MEKFKSYNGEHEVMARKKKDKNIEKEYWEEIELLDKATGKMIKQKVKIVRYKAVIENKNKKSILEELGDEEETKETGED
jgi:hypothetical protein